MILCKTDIELLDPERERYNPIVVDITDDEIDDTHCEEDHVSKRSVEQCAEAVGDTGYSANIDSRGSMDYLNSDAYNENVNV